MDHIIKALNVDDDLAWKVKNVFHRYKVVEVGERWENGGVRQTDRRVFVCPQNRNSCSLSRKDKLCALTQETLVLVVSMIATTSSRILSQTFSVNGRACFASRCSSRESGNLILSRSRSYPRTTSILYIADFLSSRSLANSCSLLWLCILSQSLQNLTHSDTSFTYSRRCWE